MRQGLIRVHVGGSRAKFFRTELELWTDNLFGGLFTYILFWTVLYGMVHIY